MQFAQGVDERAICEGRGNNSGSIFPGIVDFGSFKRQSVFLSKEFDNDFVEFGPLGGIL
jgi:hypothetical protein